MRLPSRRHIVGVRQQRRNIQDVMDIRKDELWWVYVGQRFTGRSMSSVALRPRIDLKLLVRRLPMTGMNRENVTLGGYRDE